MTSLLIDELLMNRKFLEDFVSLKEIGEVLQELLSDLYEPEIRKTKLRGSMKFIYENTVSILNEKEILILKN